MAISKLMDADFTGKGVTGLADIPNLSANEMQRKFDEIGREVLAPKLNEVIHGVNEHLETENPHSVTKAQIGLERVDNTADVEKPVSGPQAAAMQELFAQTSAFVAAHEHNSDNPHHVTAKQVGAATEQYVRDAIATVTGEGDGEASHALLKDRDAEDQHPMRAITGLTEALSETELHAMNQQNPHRVTAEQLTGVLSIEQGGTGNTTASAALSALGGLSCSKWAQTLHAGTDTLLCKIFPAATYGAFLLNVVYAANAVSVSDVYMVSMAYGSINISKIADGGYVSTNKRTVKAWAKSSAFGGNGGGVLITMNSVLGVGTTAVTAYCSYVPLTSNMGFLKYEAGEQEISGEYSAYATLTTRNGQNLVDGNFSEDMDNRGCYYRVVNGEQEWINPPLEVGVEYRTTERYLGKAVYARMYDCGECGKGRTSITINLAYDQQVRYYSGWMPFFYGDQKPGYNPYDMWISVMASAINVHINGSEPQHIYCVVYYTKV